jgi:hypothetical protein
MKLILASAIALLLGSSASFAAGETPAIKPTAPMVSPTQLKCKAGESRQSKLKAKKPLRNA